MIRVYYNISLVKIIYTFKNKYLFILKIDCYNRKNNTHYTLDPYPLDTFMPL